MTNSLLCSNKLYLLGGAHGNHDVKSFTLEFPVTLHEGTNNLSILSVMVGLPVQFSKELIKNFIMHCLCNS